MDQLLAKIEKNKKKTGFTINEAGEVSNEDLFASIISKYRGHTLLVDFWATWCGPCMRQGPIVEELGEEGYAVGKLDVDQNMELAQQFRVMSIPTLIIFKNGAEAHRLVGLTDKEELKKLLDE